MKTNRAIGFTLLFLGVGIILFSLVSSYLIFTGYNNPPELFLASQGAQGQEFSAGSAQDLQEQLPLLISQQLQGLLPEDAVSQALNLFVWSMIGGLLVFGGTMIAGIGVKLVK